ncbi:MAG: DUF4856 domain-containing protein [Nonlabens sp.]
MRRIIFLPTTWILATLLFTSCEDDNTDVNNLENLDPATYSFERDGSTSVSFDGQTTRLDMAEALIADFKTPSSTEDTFINRFAHEAGENNFDDADLNASDKSIRSKVAASQDYFFTNTTDQAAIRADFESWISGQVNEVFPAWNTIASAGVAGNLQQAGGGTTRYINAKGLEYDQAFTKSLIGSLMVDQILNNYLSSSVLDAGSNRTDNNNVTLADGKNYTNMEHKWDEAFGYLYGLEADLENPELNKDSFLNKYLFRVVGDDDFSEFGNDIYDAFKLGRAAIVAGNYELRDEQAEIIRKKISELIGIRVVYYLENGANDINADKAKAFHDLSEGYGFIYSLQFTREPNSNSSYFTKVEVDSYLNRLMQGNGFWDTTPEMLRAMSSEIAARFDFTVEQARN